MPIDVQVVVDVNLCEVLSNVAHFVVPSFDVTLLPEGVIEDVEVVLANFAAELLVNDVETKLMDTM